MKKVAVLLILGFILTTMLSGCYNAERHARRMNESFENIFLDGTGIN